MASVHEFHSVEELEAEIEDSEKTFYFVRHGKTFANEFLDNFEWGDPTFEEPEMYDTNLSHKGVAHAISTHEELISDLDLRTELQDVELVVCSPLSRTLQTAQYLFYHKEHLLPPNVRRIVHPLVRERLFMTSDVGRLKHILEEEYPGWDFSELPTDEWWFVHNEEIHEPYVEWRSGKYLCKGEASHIFAERLKELRQWLVNRPEKKILVVGHWGVFMGLTGMDFKNCQLRKFKTSDLLEEPDTRCLG